MNEELIRGIVKLKLDMLHSLLDVLPEENAQKVHRVGKVIFETVRQYYDPETSEKFEAGSGEIKEVVIE